MAYLAQRNIGIFSTDFDSFDFKMRKPELCERNTSREVPLRS
jgi:hypothetical protein